MIINTLKSSNNIILTSIQASNNKQAVQAYMQQLALLNASTSQLDHLLNLVYAISEKGIAIGKISSDTVSSLAEAINNCGEKTYDHSLDSATVSALKSAVIIFRNELDSSWKTLAKNECTPIIESITSLRGLLDNKKEADELLVYYEKVMQNMPASSSAFDTYQKNVERGRKIIDNLSFSSDPEVRSFIRKVGSMRATVKDLTPHIIEWLNDNNLTSKIRLRF